MRQTFLLLYLFVHAAVASQLSIYDDRGGSVLHHTSDVPEIADRLREIGVRFEQWQRAQPFTPFSSAEDIENAYKADIDRLTEENGFQSVDVLRVSPDYPNKVELRQKFLREHTHNEPEVRFFVEGSGLFCLHVEECVYAVLCEAGDLISIPQDYRHWFDMGPHPFFTAIRFFTRADGWIPQYTAQ